MINPIPYLTKIFLLAFIYYFAGKFSFFLTEENSIVSLTVFASEGFALAAAIIWGTKILPGIFIGQFFLAITSGLDLTPTLEISFINTIEAYLGYFLFHKYLLDKRLLKTKDIIGLLILISFVLQIFSSTFGNLALLSNSIITEKELTTSLFSWWFGNSMGQILFTPALLLLYSNYKKIDFLKLFIIAIGVTFINYSLFFLLDIEHLSLVISIIAPILILILYKKSLTIAIASTISVSMSTLYFTYLGVGLFTYGNNLDNLIDLNLYILLLNILILTIGILFQEKENEITKVAELKNKFINIFENASDGVAIITDNSITDCNSSLLKILNYQTKEEFLHLTFANLSPEFQPNGNRSYRQILQQIRNAKNRGVNSFEWVIKKRSGEEFWTELTFTNISNNSDELIIYILVRDIQYRKSLEDKILNINKNLELKVVEEVKKNREKDKQLLMQNRLAQMGEMISMIAHQWRQPLNNLSLVNQLLISKYDKNRLDTKAIDYFKKNSKKQIDFMSKTIDDFRNFFKSEQNQQEFIINGVILNIIEIVKPIFVTNNIAINFNEEVEYSITGFSNTLFQALLNIINNAKDALVEKSDIENKRIDISIKETQNYIALSIKDNAGGISEDIIHQIFDPYFSTKGDKNGTGLGLYMTKMIIEDQCNSKIEVINEDDGVNFKIYLNKERDAQSKKELIDCADTAMYKVKKADVKAGYEFF